MRIATISRLREDSGSVQLADSHGSDRIPRPRFSYGDTPVLNHVSATIEAGQTVALVGGTGSGKSTLISLLARLHDPPPGTVFIDGIDVRECRWPRFGAPSASFRRSRSCSRTRWPITSRSGWTRGRGGIGRSGRKAAGQAGRKAARRPSCRLGTAANPRCRSSRASRQRRRRFPEGLRDDGRRARHYALGRTETAHGSRARHRHRPAHPDPRRCPVGGGHLYRRGDPVAAARRHARADVDHRVAPDFDRQGCRHDSRCSMKAASPNAARTTS